MKTTVDLSPALLAELRRVAAHDGTTMRALVEEALRRALAERRGRSGFRLRRVSFGGQGLVEDLADQSGEKASHATRLPSAYRAVILMPT